MVCYLCKHCKALTNFPVDAFCEDSPTGEHEWLSGKEVTKAVQMDWQRDPEKIDELVSVGSR